MILCSMIYYIFVKKNKDFIFIIFMLLIFNIMTVEFYVKINDCGIFKTVILIEFIIFSSICSILVLLNIFTILSFYGYKIYYKIYYNFNNHISSSNIIINIPQYAVPANETQFRNVQVLEASQVNITIGTKI